FASNIVKVYELSYEYIKTLKIKTDKNEPEPIKDFLESRVPIIKILSFDSPLFKTLFNGLSTRELVLMLREIESLSIKNGLNKENDFEKLHVSDLCFSHIYNRYKKLINKLPEDSRYYTYIGDVNKDSEFYFVVENIEKLLSEYIQSDEYVSFFSKRSSILNFLMEANKKEKENSLFWLWFLENMLFMNGYFKNFPKIVLLEILNHDFKYLNKFIGFWKNFNYSIENITEILEMYVPKTPIEENMAIQIDSTLSKYIPELVLRKENNDYVHLFKILESVANIWDEDINKHYINVIRELIYGNPNRKINYMFFSALLENFKDKILNKIDNSKEYYKFSLFLLLYFNLIRILYQFLTGEVKKYFKDINIEYQSVHESSVRFIRAIEEATNIKKELDWWKYAERKQIKTVLERIEKIKKLFDLMNVEDSNIDKVREALDMLEKELQSFDEKLRLENILKDDSVLSTRLYYLKNTFNILKSKIEKLITVDTNIKTIFSIIFLLFVVNIKKSKIKFPRVSQNSPILEELSKDKPFFELYNDSSVKKYIGNFSDLAEIKEIINFYANNNENENNSV
ncbi:hypothetical protein, partial [Persephonella sp.]